MKKMISLLASFAFLICSVVAEHPLIDVYELTPRDELGEMVTDTDMVFFMVMDTSHEDYDKFLHVYNRVASDLIHFQFQPTQWFRFDALKHPEMEDVREARAINTMDFVPKSRMTGNPVGSYVFAIRDGTPRVLEYKYNPESDVQGNIEAL